MPLAEKAAAPPPGGKPHTLAARSRPVADQHARLENEKAAPEDGLSATFYPISTHQPL